MVFIGLFFIFTPDSTHATEIHENYKLIYSSVPILRMSFMLIFVIFASGVNVHVFTAYGINYLYVLDLDPQYKMTHHTLYRVASFLFFVWSTCFALTVAQMRLVYLFEGKPAYLIVFLFIFFVVYCF
jgi:hypothetical protein